jgi:RNA polymerase sigma-70 factor (ECF subfamily)
MNKEEESQLIREAQQGSAEAFMMLSRRYQNKIFNLIYRLTKSREDAADLTQETFLNAFRAIKSFRADSSFHTWLHRIAVNLSLNFLKKHKQEKKSLEYVENLENGEKETGRDMVFTEDSSAAVEMKASLEKAIDELPPVYKAAFSLVVFQGLSHREAGEVLACSESTVSWRMHEARKILKEKLKPYLSKAKGA